MTVNSRSLQIELRAPTITLLNRRKVPLAASLNDIVDRIRYSSPAARQPPGRTRWFPEGFPRFLSRHEICRWRIRVSRARERADQKSEDTSEHDHDDDDIVDDDEGGNDDDKEVRARIDRRSRGRVSTNKTGGRGGGWRSSKLPQALVRGGGRLGWLEGVPFQTLRIDLFVDGPPSLHPLLVVVDHVLKLFQRPFYPAGSATNV